MKSIMQFEMNRCYICGSRQNLEHHHAMHGFANRKKADKDGLVVMLCAKCHRDLHDHGYEDKWIQRQAMGAWCRYYGKTLIEWRQRYGKVIV